ncbi:MAG TPA: nucleotidyltransferase family protein [Allosphingosinicella sp.]|nr:nucleotidyltransferase family protein [Allosphingosinicella sp.]
MGPSLVDGDSLAGLASGVRDWPAFFEQADHHLVLPLVLNQAAILAPFWSRDQLAALRRQSGESAALNLRLARTILLLHRTWFEPERVRYAVVKGIAVASRYYGGIAERSCRDLDLLVDRDAFAATVTYLCGAGFNLCRPFQLPADPRQHARHIEALCDLSREVSFRSPDGDLIDVHHNLDLSGADMPTDRLLGRVEHHDMLGAAIPVLRTADLFVYLCYHHSRHAWSRLHWVADLSRVAAAPDFDRDSVLAAARRSGLEKLVAACFEMPALLAAAVRRDAAMPPGLAGGMAGECLTYLVPGTLPPLLVQHQRSRDRLFRWKRWFEITASEWRRRSGLRRKLRTLGRSMTPSWQAYLDMPLPRPLRWLYVPLRIVTHLVRFTPIPRLRSSRSRAKAEAKPAGNDRPTQI